MVRENEFSNLDTVERELANISGLCAALGAVAGDAGFDAAGPVSRAFHALLDAVERSSGEAQKAVAGIRAGGAV